MIRECNTSLELEASLWRIGFFVVLLLIALGLIFGELSG